MKRPALYNSLRVLEPRESRGPQRLGSEGLHTLAVEVADHYREVLLYGRAGPFFCCLGPFCGRSWPQDPAKRVGLYLLLRKSRVISWGGPF